MSIAALHSVVLRLRPRAQLFAKAYATAVWGSAESRSGEGSEVGATTAIRPLLSELFDRLSIRTFLDAPCGDWNWMRLVDLTGVDYIGADIVSAVIASNQARFSRPGVRFMVADLTRDELPRADLVLCRDCWEHLSFQGHQRGPREFSSLWSDLAIGQQQPAYDQQYEPIYWPAVAVSESAAGAVPLPAAAGEPLRPLPARPIRDCTLAHSGLAQHSPCVAKAPALLRACFENHTGLRAKRRTMNRIIVSFSSVALVCTLRA